MVERSDELGDDGGGTGDTGDGAATALPDQVRGKLAEIVSAALGHVDQRDVPPPVRVLARFAPAKRAKLAGTTLVDAVLSPDSVRFRAAVVQWCRTHRADALDVDSDNVAVAAAAALLTEQPVARRYVELVARRTSEAALRAERDVAESQRRKLEERVERLRHELSGTGGTASDELRRLTDEISKLRGRLREQGVKLREARDAAESASAAAEHIRSDADLAIKTMAAERDRAVSRADKERARAQRAQAAADTARQSAREARAADEVRLALLLRTLEGTVGGLRRELALPGDGDPAGALGSLPADLVRSARAFESRPAWVADTVALDRLLVLPAVHVIVDGYNVTKTGYPQLPLAQQRERLARQLSVLAARTSAEVTVVFDGADVKASTVAGARGVRVLFSEPEVLADDVIRELVAAEPHGRPLVVVSSDREVADSVRMRGAHPVPSAVLLARLSRR